MSEKEIKVVKGYKAFDKDLKCHNDFQYEVGKEYVLSKKPKLCRQGFHFCKKMNDCYNYESYSFNKDTTRICEIEAFGIIEESYDDSKCVTDKIRIVRELPWKEIVKRHEFENGNLGTGNHGVYNTGNGNCGKDNFGDNNQGDGNNGNDNRGKDNVGKYNRGHGNNGELNIGSWNSGKRNIGFFNTMDNKEYPSEELYMFNKKVKRNAVNELSFCDFFNEVHMTEWVDKDDMTDKEKEENPSWKYVDGYLRTVGYKEAWRKAFQNAKKTRSWESEKARLLALPNFDFEIFEQITGITKKEITE